MTLGSLNNKIYFKYYNDNLDCRKVVKSTVTNFLKQIHNKDAKQFLNGYEFVLVDKYNQLPPQSPLTKYLYKEDIDKSLIVGMTAPPIANNKRKEVVLKSNKNIFAGINRKLDNTELSNITMHEIGHIFDDYFIEENIPIGLENILSKTDLTENEQKIVKDWMNSKDLSDSEEFKNAWKKDMEFIGQNPYKTYISKKFYSYFHPFDINIKDGISEKEVSVADKSRSEIFAQLFTYTVGYDDKRKKSLCSMYPNSFEVVKKYVDKFLKLY